MATEKKTLAGGVRSGAGRPAIAKSDKVKPLMIYLSDVDKSKFKTLGGTKWLRIKLSEAIEKHKPA